MKISYCKIGMQSMSMQYQGNIRQYQVLSRHCVMRNAGNENKCCAYCPRTTNYALAISWFDMISIARHSAE
jgi:hypothetical protein